MIETKEKIYLSERSCSVESIEKGMTTSQIRMNYKNKVDGLELLKEIADESVSACFFDPQYRGILDKLSYGNEGKSRGKNRSNLPQMTNEMIMHFILEIDRVLKPSGHMFLWVDKFHLCEGVNEWLINANMQIVDLVTWDKTKIGMGYRTRRRSEYCLIIQKKPIKAKGVWRLHNIPDVWSEKIIKTHAHSKPINLQKALIEATTLPGDIVIDPASGGFSVLECCQLTGREFIGGDLVFGDE